MRIYHHPFSSNARKVLITTHLLGITPELVTVDLGKGAQRKPEFLAMNPNGKVPVLEDDGFVLWESHAIMAYLADKTPGQTLYPTDLRARADVNRWMFWSAYHWVPAIAILNWENMIKKMVGAGEPDPAQVKHGEEQIAALAPILDAHLAKREWMCGDKITLADISIATPLMSTAGAKLPVTQYPNLQKWFGRVQALDAWKKTSL